MRGQQVAHTVKCQFLGSVPNTNNKKYNIFNSLKRVGNKLPTLRLLFRQPENGLKRVCNKLHTLRLLLNY